MTRFLNIFNRIDAIFSALAAIALGLIMLIATADVLMRYAFNDPLHWSHETIRLYLIPVIVYFAVSATFREGAHISVDLLQYRFSRRMRHVSYLIISALTVILFAAIAWVALWRAVEEFIGDDVLAGAILWPVWWSSAFVCLGSILLTIRAAVHVVLHLQSVRSGEDLIELTPLATAENAARSVGESVT